MLDNDDLLGYYNQELDAIRQLGQTFAKRHPKVAGKLRLGPGELDDPHVSRLLQGFAFLTARIHQRLEDDFPALTDALLDLLYPHYLKPIPALSIVRFHCQPELTGAVEIPKDTDIESDPRYGQTCLFRTCLPTSIWPIEVMNAALLPQPAQAPAITGTGYDQKLAAILKLSLRCQGAGITFSQLAIDRLRFYIKAPSPYAFQIQETLLNHVFYIVVTGHDQLIAKQTLGADNIVPVGFESAQGLFPYPNRSFLGYRLLTEYFCFPEKFLFFDLMGFDLRACQDDAIIDVYCYLDHYTDQLAPYITSNTFQLGCTPIVNLFSQSAEPIRIDHRSSDYPVIADARRNPPLSIYSVEKVVSITEDGSETQLHPFYGSEHTLNNNNPGHYWCLKRYDEKLHVAFVDLAFNPSQLMPEQTIDMTLLCTNGDLPSQLPFGGSEPRLQLREGAGAITQIVCLHPFSAQVAPPVSKESYWHLLSHLNLNHLSLSGGEHGAKVLRQMLRLYSRRERVDTEQIIDSVKSVDYRRALLRSPQGIGSPFCHGIKVTVQLDAHIFNDKSLFLFGAVLNRFFSLYASVNAFTQLDVQSYDKKELLYQWPACIGDKILF